MKRVYGLPAKTLFVAFAVLIGIVVSYSHDHRPQTGIARNYQSLRVMRAAINARQTDGFIAYTSELADLKRALEQYAIEHPTEQAHPLLVTLSLWADDLTAAQRWQKASVSARQRAMDSQGAWQTLTLVRIDWPSWTYSRKMLVSTAWLAAMDFREKGMYSDALQWFRRGISLTPGRIRQEVRKAYYQTLSMWYSSQSSTVENQRLAAKFACLGDEIAGCLQSIVAEMPAHERPEWIIPDSAGNHWKSASGWRLLGLDLDEDIMSAGVDVVGLLYWSIESSESSQVHRQLFVVPNMAPNSGFEFQKLFTDACVDGYVGSHAFVLPCVSQIRPDPLQQRDGLVATTLTSETGYLLTAASAEAKSEHAYVYGARLCSAGEAEARLGVQFTSDALIRQNAYEGLRWLLTERSTERSNCWSRQAGVETVPAKVETTRIWLGGFGNSSAQAGYAAFDTVFLFDLSQLKARMN